MLRADELYNEVTQDVASKGAAQGMFIGCFVDTATGFITFTCEGKETKHRFKVDLSSSRLFIQSVEIVTDPHRVLIQFMCSSCVVFNVLDEYPGSPFGRLKLDVYMRF